MKTIHASGKRKRAIARATLKEGKGRLYVNNQELSSFGSQMARQKIQEPLLLAGDIARKVDIHVRVAGGGVAGQSDAARLAVSKALVEYSKDKKMRQDFLQYDRRMLVADVRRKEAKKPNRHSKARAKVQKSYR